MWQDEGWIEPAIEEQFDPDRMILTLEFRKKQAKKTIENMGKIKKYLQKNGESKASDISENIGLSSARTRAIIAEMEDVEALGGNSNRTYKLK